MQPLSRRGFLQQASGVVAGLATGLAPICWAQEADVSPTINETFKNKDLNVDN